MVNAVAYSVQQLTLFGEYERPRGGDTRDISCGRTSPGHSHATKELILEPCLRKSDRPKFQYLNMANGQNSEYEAGKVATLRASGGAYGGGSENLALSYSIVRRLTPTECERLQGLEDRYTDGGSDTARYKALGNGMVQPCADYVIRRIAEATRAERKASNDR